MVDAGKALKKASRKPREKDDFMQEGALPSTSFNTTKIQDAFRNPSGSSSAIPEAHKLVAPHIESFNELFISPDLGGVSLLDMAVADVATKTIFDGDRRDKGKAVDRGYHPLLGNRLDLSISGFTVASPMQPQSSFMQDNPRYYPADARERMETYAGEMSCKLIWAVNGEPVHSELKKLGMLPIMVRSERCHLKGMAPAALVKHREEAEELGGYFIINGNEKIIRFLIVPRRNHVIALNRPSFGNRGKLYTAYGVQIRSVRPDQSGLTSTLHYLKNGCLHLRFSWRKNEYMIPLMMILKALLDDEASDKNIYAGIMQNDFANTYYSDRAELLLRTFKDYGLRSGRQCRAYLGKSFRIVLGCPEDWSNERVGRFLLERIVLVHLDEPADKFRMLLFMVRKLYALVAGDCCADNPDSPQHQEILMPGFLYATIIKEKLSEYLDAIATQFRIDMRRQAVGATFEDTKWVRSIFAKVSPNIGTKISTFLATGNLVSSSGLDLQQASGFTIVAEKLNFLRFISHFRCVHRGAFFAELKTTTVRKLLPEAWGFLCPVHTPDGSPCGLLNHFAHKCLLVSSAAKTDHLAGLLSSMGMTQPFERRISGKTNVCVQLDGRIIGWATPDTCERIAIALRRFKTEGRHKVPRDLEVGLVPPSSGGQYPGLFLFSTRARMMRPVRLLANGQEEHIGPFEQVYLNIACTADEIEAGVHSHVEFAATNVLSVLANLTPFSDYNQSPRNMYQCQMGKQTMGTPSTALTHRTDNKLYRIQTGQTPIVRPALHDTYGFDGYPNGFNAVVAVISYTGYDMEDAMIINKSAYERGFGHGSVYKSHTLELASAKGAEGSAPNRGQNLIFGFGADVPASHTARQRLDGRGIPHPGMLVRRGDIYAAYYNTTTKRTHYDKYESDEEAYIDTVRLIAGNIASNEGKLIKLHLMLRIVRRPEIGDKFSSRHGQKGVCSQRFPAIDLPFSESGMQPDVIINPHAFPSRMTIGMLIESLAGKAGALHGFAQDATPFCYSEDDTPQAYFGEQLKAAGYNYHGNEPMYSGITGEEFKADIYLGMVYYQRLRHMVSDKYQVRTTGPVDKVTRQPVKGRKKGGGIRFGEMERDALLAHGTSFLLQDRLMNCSDYSTAWVCRTCGSLISLGYDDQSYGTEVGLSGDLHESGPNGQYCRVCRAEEIKQKNAWLDEQPKLPLVQHRVTAIGKGKVVERRGQMDLIAVPFVFRYLCAELAAMGISLSIDVA
ncbi:uncharacterized protein L969DRAFT_94546 [Mixia osmundae IAM 14324]|uniref:DNA-directed RNA polymerase subunit beta n=1 Tax=Mixia osmundae (strain CBS 9802 / IAM 14324 / JCM 22182 / KY 12970) TaxID=764103 RepID=G7E0U6_MIXOS|nr:uncharacterized protein L969DRAFT_94546 [Mixia osmundae IAM 14324]KEI39485.1 hypothetical protein L969DRAFT_94546 [Mixia osmundae IAM 14324]GAA96456.1 hypothetical protein E5Q_03123 [Mixia osmundae IAM 14324]